MVKDVHALTGVACLHPAISRRPRVVRDAALAEAKAGTGSASEDVEFP
ncbi:MAG: hypothetical protein WB392_04180 [Methanotrichaceae archaeon]